ncbi:DUF5995 family protein [Streptomyces sp. CB01881]|uniref:DUF5995 family protein n=1 Tax=Streptomyces sp. CB01881 TaxID=2078691 RepID=UPI000CDC7255|nr:DUF5995 family protein [Streptomyces sp. CB01881]AUY49189.1 hypothetical protein C2142_09820 [Streptomyces sp. CB01881]TYC77679.1 hypothetical protein EH183_09830 [Streptomyces sp. CB01881]
MTQSRTRSAQSVEEVVERMRAIKDRLDPRDGVACFNRMYLRVTELVGERLQAGYFHDQAFIERLDVVFANLYFDAVDAAEAGSPVNASWQPLFEARDNRVVWPVQFAFAGMNAHINHDLPLAVVSTCIERRTTPDTPPVHADYLKVNELLAQVEAEVRASFEVQVLRAATGATEPLKHIVASFSIARARDAAWATTQILWHQRNLRPFYDATLATVTAGAALAGRLIVTPVLPPVDRPDGGA